MKKIIVLLLAVSITSIARAQFDSTSDPILTRSLKSETIKTVIAGTSGGNIIAIGISSGEPKLEVYARRNGKIIESSKADIQKLLDENYELNISVDGGELRVIAKPKYGSFRSNNKLSISFKIFVPQNVSTNLQTSGGDISLSDLTGDERFGTSGGDIKLAGLHGNINGQTSGGDIKATNSSGNISLATSGGSLKLDSLSGVITVLTSGGDISGNNIGGSFSTRTSGGNVTLQDLTCSLDASTSGGNMRVSVKELGKYITLQNLGGNISLSLPAAKGLNLKLRASKINWNTLSNFSGSKDERSLIGTLNGGGIPVTAETSDKITLAFK